MEAKMKAAESSSTHVHSRWMIRWLPHVKMLQLLAGCGKGKAAHHVRRGSWPRSGWLRGGGRRGGGRRASQRWRRGAPAAMPPECGFVLVDRVAGWWTGLVERVPVCSQRVPCAYYICILNWQRVKEEECSAAGGAPDFTRIEACLSNDDFVG